MKLDDERTTAKTERWRRIAEQAARQSGRSDPPAIDTAGTLTGALALASSIAEARFILDPRATTSLGAPLAAALSRRLSLAFAVGPEGGFTEEEIASARASGFEPVTLGAFVLRTETVAAAVLGAVRIMEAP